MSRKFQVKAFPCFEQLQSELAAAPRWLQETRSLFSDKVSDKDRADALACLEMRLNQQLPLSDIRHVSLSDLSSLNKNNGFNTLATRLFFPNGRSIDQVESKRLTLLAVLKNKNLVDEEAYRFLYWIYKSIYLGKLTLEFVHDQTDNWRKICKSIMTSLKKMMVLKTKKPRSSLKPSKDSQRYTVNLDVKALIKCCEKKCKEISDKVLASRIHDLLEQTKNGWAGPRLWKIVHEQKWTSYEIENFIRMFQVSHEEYAHPRSDLRKLKVAVNRILTNLNALSSNTRLEISTTQDSWDDLMLELPACSKDDLEIELQNYEEDYYSAAVGEHRSVSVEDGTFD
jgi:hypothetical protein